MRALAFSLLFFAALAPAEQVRISVLATTDMHGNLLGVDYVTDQPAARGLAKLATVIRAEQAANPNNLLIDCGDTIQGTPLESAYQTLVRTGAGPLGLKPAAPLAVDPMMAAMNKLGYAAMTVGNHEFNFGLKNLAKARGEAAFPWISANIAVAAGGAEEPFAPYVVKTVAGVKVAIIGITTPAVPGWEKPENIGAYRFQPALEALKTTLAQLQAKEKPDVVVAAVHAGLGRNLETGQDEESAENVVYSLAAGTQGVDAIIFGHSHRTLEQQLVNGVLLTQPKNWAGSVARMDFTLEGAAGGPWKLAAKSSRLIPVAAGTPEAADIAAIARPYHEFAESFLNTPVADAPKELRSAQGRAEDTAVVDAVQQAQLFYSKADVSFTALFNANVRIPKGKATVRQIAALYPYDNELYVVEGTGQMVKDALENSARYFRSCQGAACAQGPLTNRGVAGYNYDMAEGVDYELDLTQPEGSRVRNLKWKGAPLAPNQPLKIAINNYRAAGSAGYSMFKGAKIIWRSGEEIRDLVIRYYTERGSLPSEPSNNWRILPEAAHQTLAREGGGE